MCYYGVDSATGCFMDVDAAQAIQAISTKTIGREEFNATMSNELLQNCIYADYPNTRWAILQIEEFVNNLVHEYYPDVDWSDVDINNPTKANLIAFTSGWGDGGYPSFWGYDASNQLVSLVTDFGIFAEA